MASLQQFPAPILRLLQVTLLLVLAAGQGVSAAQGDRAEIRASGEVERLFYKVAYRGLLTSYIWMELADVEGIAYAVPDTFKDAPICHAKLTLDTEDYGFAEMVNPMRYSWSVRLSPDLARTYLMQELDLGANDFHNTTWVNYAKQRIETFRRREKKVKRSSGWDNQYDEYWEPDHIKKTLPDFLEQHPLLDNGATFLMRNKFVTKVEANAILDPLGLIYNARSHDFSAKNPYTVYATTDHNYHPYRIELRGKTTIDYQDKDVPVYLVSIRRDDEKAAKQEGEMRMYLADDPWRTPLLFEVDAPLGKMRVLLDDVERDEALLADPDSCHTIPNWKAGAWNKP